MKFRTDMIKKIDNGKISTSDVLNEGDDTILSIVHNNLLPLSRKSRLLKQVAISTVCTVCIVLGISIAPYMSDFFRGISIAEIAHADVPYLQSGYSTYSQGSYGNGYGQSSYGNGYSQSSYGYSQGSYGPSESSYDMVQTPDGDWVCANGADYTENEDGTLTEIVWIDDGDDGGSESSTK